MKTDISRQTFKSEKNYSSVRMQQGRVQLDADWNEQADILNHRDRILSIDSLGPVGAPANDAGFQVAPSGDTLDLTVSPGRFYINGMLVENASEFNVSAQTDLPGVALPSADGNYLAYLKVFERAVTALEDPSIRETALGGPDTTTRMQVIRQVHLTSVTGGDFDSRTIPPEWSAIISRNAGRLSARTQADGGADPCAVGARGGYTGLDNLLYRVEIHEGGRAGTATFKWSRDNGALVTEWLELDGNVLTVRSTGNDNVLNFKPGQWIEISDDGLELEGTRGTLAQILRVEGRRITVNPDNLQHFPGSAGTLDINEFNRGTRKVRAWSMMGATSVITVPDGGAGEVWVELESGIEVKFDDLASGRDFQTGDYWMIPARANIKNIEWACDSNGNIEHDPHGTYCHFARLAFVNLTGGAFSVIADAREIFPGLTDEELAYVGGDGQLSVPGQILDRPLEVRVTRGATPVPDAKVRFTITSGTGTIEDSPGGNSGSTLDIKADSEGIARVYWTLADAAAGQSIRAVLLDESDTETALYVTFGAGSGVASGIQYTPISTDSSVSGTTNVQEALDALADNKVNRSGDVISGDLEVQGNFTVRGDVIARDAQQQAGDVLLGDDDVDRVIITGTLESNHSSGSLEIEAPVHMRTTDPTKSPLRVDGPSTGGSPRLYRLPLDLDHTDGSATTLNDYQLLVTLDTASLIAAGRMQGDGGDILFEDSLGALLPFWVESGINTATTRIWVRVPQIAAAANTLIYMLYGNDNAASQSSSSATFLREIPNVDRAYDLDEGTGTSLGDGTGSGNTGTLVSGSWATGIYGQALSFDGTNDEATASGTSLPTGAAPRTISAWVNPASSGSDHQIAGYGPHVTGQGFYLNILNGSFRVVGVFDDVTDPGTVSLNTWSHVVGTYDGTTARLYVNGMEVASGAKTYNTQSSDFYIGRYVAEIGNNFNRFDGLIDQVRVYDRALDPAEISEMFNDPGYVSPDTGGAEFLRRLAAIEPTITAQAEEANPLSETPILFAQESSGNIGIGTDTPGEKLTVDGIIETKTGGIKFPDGTIQTTAGGGGFGSGGDSLPLGTIMAWHKSFGSTPPIPDGWVECNGQILDDVASPYNGLVIPNLNGVLSGADSPGTSGKYEMFLRGGTTSGEGQLDQFQGHRHLRVPTGAHEAFWTPGGVHHPPATGGFSFNGLESGTITGDPVDGVQGPIRQGDETRPVNMSVVWIMKIKETDGVSGLWQPGAEGIHYDQGTVSVGTDVSDENLTVSGAISLEEKVLEPDTTDDFGKIYVRENDLSHLTLNGTDQYVVMPALGNTAVGDFTIALWFRMRRENPGPNDRNYVLDLRGDGVEIPGTASLIIDNGPNGTSLIDHSAMWATGGASEFRLDIGNIVGEWHHTALVREGAVLRAYFDGRLLSDDPAFSGPPKSDPQTWDHPWRLGTHALNVGINYWFDGDLDDLGLWTRALSDDEMAALHNGGRGSDVTTGFASSLLAFYPMSPSLTPGQLDDVSGNNFHGTIQNGATITPERVGSLYFKDGFGNVTALAGGGDSYRTGGSGNQVPVGTIMAWHKSMNNTPAIPDGWVECNGQTLDDPASPYHGQAIPDLNNPKESWNSKGSFLRGDSTSGDFEDDTIQSHRHNFPVFDRPGDSFINTSIAGSGVWWNRTFPTDPTSGRIGPETRPVNMSVVWIMKVRETDRDRGLWRESGEDIYFDDGKVGIGVKDANAKLHVSAEDTFETPLRIDAQITQQGVQGRLYRRAIDLANTEATDIADFQTSVTIDTLALVQAGKMRADGGDMLFVDSDGTTILPHFIQSGMNTAETKVWIRVPTIAESATRTVFMQYGKPQATQGDSPEATFADIIDGVVVAYDMDEGSGTLLTDSSGNGFNTAHDAGWTAGHRGPALDFNGSNQNVSGPVRNWGFGSTGSVSVWIKTTNTGVQRPIMSLQHGNVQDEFLLYMHTNNKVAVYNHKSAGNSIRRESDSLINTGEWIHIVAVMDGGVDASQLRLYINGVREEGVFTSTGSPAPILDSTPRALHIGFRANVNDYWLGQIDKFRLYSTALTDADVAALYTGETFLSASEPNREFVMNSLAANPGDSTTLEITNLAAVYNFNEGSGTSVTDYSGNSNTGTITGAVYTDDRNGDANRALLFDGADDGIRLGNGASLNISSDISLSAWIRNTGPGTGQDANLNGFIIGKHFTNNSRSYDIFFNHTSQTVQFDLIEPDNTQHILNSGVLSYNEWYHIAATYDSVSGAMTLYVDGAEAAATNIGSITLLQTSVPATIGAQPDDLSATALRHFFQGEIDEARIYNRALTAEEIADIHRFGSDIESVVGTELVYTNPNDIVDAIIAAEEPNPVSGSPILFAQNLTGNIGIGTDDPQAKLHIVGTAGVDGIMFPDGTVQTTAGGGAGGGDSTPIGTIIAWHKSLSGAPTIPDGWVECNGQVLVDPESPLNGTTIPDLNGEGRFLRGAAASGVVQEDALQGHWHEISRPDFPSRRLSEYRPGSSSPGDLVTGINERPDNYFATDLVDDTVNGTPRIADETRPKNMTVVWIMKVRDTGAQAGLWTPVADDATYTTGNVGIGTTVTNEALTVDGRISIKETVSAPDADAGFGKLFTKETNLSYLLLDGDDDRALMPPLNQTSVGDFTLSIWFKRDPVYVGTPTYDRDYLLDMRTSLPVAVALLLDTDSQMNTFIEHGAGWPTGGNMEFREAVGNVSDEWHHTAVVRRGTVMEAYLDGRLISNNPRQGGAVKADLFDWDQPWTIGVYREQSVNGSPNRFKGSLDDAAVWTRALSQDEMAAMFASGRGTDLTELYSADLAGFWPMDDGPLSTTIRDASGNGIDGALENGASLVDKRVGSLFFKDGFGNVTALSGSGDSHRSPENSGGDVPLGTIMAWHRDIVDGTTPPIPDGWVECDGNPLDDPASPYHGQIIPNLNADGRFLRGGTGSGTLQDHALEDHRHFWNNFQDEDSSALWIHRQTFGTESSLGILTGSGPNDSAFNTSIGDVRSANVDPNETRPINMSVIWIMKVRETNESSWEERGDNIFFEDGNVGIGTDRPREKLSIDGFMEFLSGGIKFPDGTIQTTAATRSDVPLGTIVAWHKDLSGTPAIPEDWIECNGQLIADVDSPYNGTIVPNLNGDPAGADSPGLTSKAAMFLRGGTASGGGQEDAFQGHHHSIVNANAVWTQGAGPHLQPGTGNDPRTLSVTDPISDGSNGTPRTADETRPVNMAVVWIMKFKDSGSIAQALTRFEGADALLPEMLYPTNDPGLHDSIDSMGRRLFYTTIRNRAPMLSPETGMFLGPRRIMLDSAIEAEGEFGPSGEKVWKLDGRDDIRIIGEHRMISDANGNRPFFTPTDGAWIEVTANMSSLRLLTYLAVDNGDANISINGASPQAIQAETSTQNPYGDRFTDAGSLLPDSPSMTPGLNTAVIRAENNFNAYGLEVAMTPGDNRPLLPAQKALVNGRRVDIDAKQVDHKPDPWSNGYGLNDGVSGFHDMGLETWENYLPIAHAVSDHVTAAFAPAVNIHDHVLNTTNNTVYRVRLFTGLGAAEHQADNGAKVVWEQVDIVGRTVGDATILADLAVNEVLYDSGAQRVYKVLSTSDGSYANTVFNHRTPMNGGRTTWFAHPTAREANGTGMVVSATTWMPPAAGRMAALNTSLNQGLFHWTHFAFDGNHYLAAANEHEGPDYTVDSRILRLTDGAWTELQTIPTVGAAHWEYFTFDSRHFLAVANSQDNGNYDVDSKIYEWNGTQFVEFQTIGTSGIRKWHYFEIATDRFLVAVESRSGASTNIDSNVYQWNGTTFVQLQGLATEGGFDVVDFDIAGTKYLAFAHQVADGTGSNTNSGVWRWNGINFTQHQTIPTENPWFVEYFSIGSDHFLAYPALFDNSSWSLQSEIWKWDGSNFVLSQSVNTIGGFKWHYFEIGARRFLGIANRGTDTNSIADSEILEWDGSQFVSLQTIPGIAPWDIRHMHQDGEDFLVLANQRDAAAGTNEVDSTVFRWNGVRFAEHQKLRAPSCLQAEPFNADGSLYLAMASFANDTNLTLYSPIYRYEENTRKFITTYGGSAIDERAQGQQRAVFAAGEPDFALMEHAKTIHAWEFGNGDSNGATTRGFDTAPAGSSSNRAYVLDDGLTALVGENIMSTSDASTRVAGTGKLELTFMGTGLRVNLKNEGDLPALEGYNADGNYAVASNLSCGTHVLRISSPAIAPDAPTSYTLDNTEMISGGASFNIESFEIYQPRRADVPEHWVALGDYMLMAETIQATESGTGSIVAGANRRHATHDFWFDDTVVSPTWVIDPSARPAEVGGLLLWSGAAAKTVRYRLPFYGHGLNIRFSDIADVDDFTIRIDGSSDLSAFTTAVTTGSLVDATGAYTASKSGESASIISLLDIPLGEHLLEVEATTEVGTHLYVNAVDVLSPVHRVDHYREQETPYLLELTGGGSGISNDGLLVFDREANRPREMKDAKTVLPWLPGWTHIGKNDASSISGNGTPYNPNMVRGEISNPSLQTTGFGMKGFIYNPTTGQFVVKETGVYQINAHILANGGTNGNIFLEVNGVRLHFFYSVNTGAASSSGGDMLTLPLKKNDLFRFAVEVGTIGTSSTIHSWIMITKRER